MTQPRQEVMEQYESLTPLVRPGDWEYATDELKDNTTFEDGIIENRIAHFYPKRNSHVTSHGWTFYKGSEESNFDYYIVCRNLPQSWDAWGCNREDFGLIFSSFQVNPFMLSNE